MGAGPILKRSALAGRFGLVTPAAGSTAVIPNGQMFLQAWDLAIPLDIDQTLIEVVTTPGGAGSVVHGAWYLDDGTFDRPGALFSDLGTVTTATTGIKTFATALTLPAGRMWVGMAPQGAAAPDPTLRVAIAGGGAAYHSTVSMANLLQQYLMQTGVTGAVPNPAVPNGNNSLTVMVGVRFA